MMRWILSSEARLRRIFWDVVTVIVAVAGALAFAFYVSLTIR